MSKTRFAPSPTGPLHIGGLRVALVNRLVATARGGRFMLRIDDTDEERTLPGAAEAIIRDLAWALAPLTPPGSSAPWDEGPRAAGDRIQAHREAAGRLYHEGRAYPCFAGEEELEKIRASQLAAGQPPRPGRVWRNRDPAEVRERLDRGDPYVLRLAMPLEGVAEWEDLVRGPMAIPFADLDDPVLLRRDGTPTYHLASVVDDLEYGVTDVIRGADWISSTPIHLVLCDALGRPRPRYGHLPLLQAPGGGKLSKREGSGFTVAELREAGYLPEAVLHTVLLSGGAQPALEGEPDPRRWAEKLDLHRLGVADSRWNPSLLDHLQQRHLGRLAPGELQARIAPLLTGDREGYLDHDRLLPALELVREEGGRLPELAERLDLFLAPDPPAAEPREDELFDRLISAFEGFEGWSGGAFREVCMHIGEVLGLGGRELWHPIRVQLTGRERGPELVRIAEVLGRDEVLRRLRRGRG